MKFELAVVLVAALVAGSLVASAKRPATTRIAAQPAPDAATAALLAEVNQHFTAGGKLIHPKLIWEFGGWMSDGGPIALKVDLTQSLGTNEYGEDEVNARDSKLADNGRWRVVLETRGTFGGREPIKVAADHVVVGQQAILPW